MPTIELNPDGGRIDVVSDFREKDLVKTVPGTRWDSNARAWHLPLAWSSCLAMRGVFGDSLAVGPRLSAWSRDYRARYVLPATEARTAEDADLGELPEALRKLRPYQRAGVRFMLLGLLEGPAGTMNTDDMGTGKTAQTIATLELLPDAYPALVVCPNSVKAAWARDEFPKWAPGRRVVEIGGSATNRRKQIAALAAGEYDVGVVNYEAAKLHTRLASYGNHALKDSEKEDKELNAIQFGAIVCDEAHRLKDPKAQQTRAMWWLGDRARYRIALTGTPLSNTPEDLWTVGRLVSPDQFTSKTRWVDRYAVQGWNVFGFRVVAGLRGENKDELFGYLDPLMIRRPKAVALPHLPEKTYVRRYAEMVPKQRKAYEEMRKTMLAELGDGDFIAAVNPLDKLTRLMQFANAYAEIGEDGRLVMTEPSCKVDALEDVADEIAGAQAIVFAESRQLLDLGIARLTKQVKGEARYRVGRIAGGDTPDERQAAVEAFQAGSLQFIACTLGAGGEGLTLTAAEKVIFMQRSFKMTKNLQAEDRAHRFGLAHPVEIIDIITPGTVDEMPHAAHETKSDRAQEIVRDAETLRTWLERKSA